MTSATVLLVEDNPITRKLVRFALQNAGIHILEAPDANTALSLFPQQNVDLILQDLCLPDMDGFELVSKLRALPGGSEIPILAFSGMLSHYDELRVASAGFDDLVSKPAEPSRLVQIVRSYLPASPSSAPDPTSRGRRLVIADDDAVQRKLVAFRLQRAGFEVTATANGAEALQKIQETRPDAVVSDVLMPELDGFGLCLALRKDPAFANLPIVLTTNSYVEPSDRELARRTGAHDLVLRTPELREVLEALEASLNAAPRSQLPEQPTPDVKGEHVRRMIRQLERQVALNAKASQRCALLTAEMNVLKGISEALAEHADIDEALKHTLAACFDAGGISLGLLYLRSGSDLRVLSFGFAHGWAESSLTSFFGEHELIETAMRSDSSTLIRSATASEAEQRLLALAKASSVLIVPVTHKGVSLGALVMVSRNGDFQQDDRVKFAEAVSVQISQALSVAEAFRARALSEQAAREQTAILQSVLESIGDGVSVVDDTGTLILLNTAASNLAMVGANDRSIRSAAASVETFAADGVTKVEFDDLPLVRASRGETIDGLELYVRHDRAPQGVWLSATGRPWRDDQGVARGGVAVFRDVTREKATQAQLLVSDRMASVGMLAAGVAHEINNPLACVLANVELSLRDVEMRDDATYSAPDLQELREMLTDARDAADRVRQIVRDLKIFSRHEDTRSEAIDVHKVIESSLRMAWNEIRHRARLVKDYGRIPLVEGSESRLGQVFLNLIVNAAQAIAEGSAENHVIRVSTSVEDDGRVCVSLSDTGKGIEPHNLQHLFMPFYTTKGPGVGTGLGLAISHRIVAGLGGEILVDSQVGKGTTFRVILPAAQSDEAVAGPTRVAIEESAPLRRARILVVDDEPMIASTIRRLLSREHEVVAVTSAAEVPGRIAAGESFDIILCDLMMPQMSGMELHAELQRLSPTHAERMIFLTGGAFTPAARAFLDRVRNQRVEKPFDAQHLRSLVNDRLK